MGFGWYGRRACLGCSSLQHISDARDIMHVDMHIGTLQLEDIGDHHLSVEVSQASDDDSPVSPCIGSVHQAEIPNLATDDERRHLMASSLHSCKLHVYDYPSVSIPVVWGSHPPSQVNKEDITSEGNWAYLDPHAVLPVDQIDSANNQVCDETPVQCFTQESRDLFTDKTMVDQRETKKIASLHGLSASIWTGLEEECFLLGLHIFGKNLSLVSKFIGSKTVGEVLSYYYGRFYNGTAYKRWSHLRRTRTTRCILGRSIFTGRRQQELISRLKLKISKEVHASLVEVLRSLGSDLTSLEECVFTLKSTIGAETFVEVVGIGKGKHDLTGFVQDTSKTNKGLSVSANTPKGINCSMLAREEIVNTLTGDSRRSKAKLNDLFWEAVWPRLLARGWHSEQPKDVRTTKNCLVYLVPAIKKFSRRKLTKGTHYFDSITDVLKKVAADPTLLQLETDGIDNGAPVDINGRATGQDGPLDSDLELPMFTIIDTSLVQGEAPFKVRALRSLPADANISFGCTDHSDNMSSDGSSQEQHSDGNLSDDQECHGQVTAPVNDIEMGSVYSTTKESLVDMLEAMRTAPQSVFPVNGHSSDDQHSGISSGNGDKADLTCCSVLGRKTGRLVYLSPKRRRFARYSNDQTSQHSFYLPDGADFEKKKLKPLSTTSKPTVIDLGGSFQTRTLADCSMITEVAKPTTNGRLLKKRNVVNTNEDKSSEGKFDAVARTSMGGTLPDNHDCLQKNEDLTVVNTNEDKSPSISNNEIVPDVLEAAGKHDLTVETSSRRQGTRNRPPTVRALEAVALGLLGGTKRKGDARSLMTRRPQRARKNED
ncbi:hypothetical protein TRIUR3_35205 [Triticum urartu]|uniref:Uncharacterized protein n=1 Tax=Triticum urartu TaxID=4572 RepID=M7ZB18_TRIUA|nr:hypothetical protein TRIUR3_35205 [Triticum urartu]